VKNDGRPRLRTSATSSATPPATARIPSTGGNGQRLLAVGCRVHRTDLEGAPASPFIDRRDGSVVSLWGLLVSRSKGGFLGRSTGEVPSRRFARLGAKAIRDGLRHRRSVAIDVTVSLMRFVEGSRQRQRSTSVSASSQRPIVSGSAWEATVVRVGVGTSHQSVQRSTRYSSMVCVSGQTVTP